MKASLTTPAAGSSTRKSAVPAGAPRPATAMGHRAARVQLSPSGSHAPDSRQSHPARAHGGDRGAAAIHAAAARGVATPWSTLPHAGRIQQAFGRHDVSSIQAHVGATAAASATDIRADAYTTGNHVVLGKGTDLFTVAHEAAHVIQQRAGVQLKGGVGSAGDPHERHADAVAARVTAGQSAEPLLDAYVGQSTAGAQIQCKGNTWIEDTTRAAPGQGPGALASEDLAGNPQEHGVKFGQLVNDCGSFMEAWLYPSDDIEGSKPSVRPSWWDAMRADPATDENWVSHNIVQGHLLNEHLGGPGNDMRNLTPFAKSTNSQHHAYVERAAKSIKKSGNILHYVVEATYRPSPPPAWFGHNIAPKFVKLFAREIKCLLQEYDGNTHQPTGQEETTTISNAITGQG
jgi:Domain of unknown function (DUF4157)